MVENPAWRKEDKLREDLLKGYNKHSSSPHRQRHDHCLLQIPGYEHMDRGRQTNIKHELIRPNDVESPKLTWDYKDYGMLSKLHLQDHMVWQPELQLYNNADHTMIDHFQNVKLQVNSNGTVLWIPPAVFRAECPLDYTHWPYDTQICSLYLGSWTYNGWQVNMQLLNNSSLILTARYADKRNSWRVMSSSVRREVTTYPCCPEPYITLHMVITLARTSPSFVCTVVLPACVISVLTLVQFVLPLREPRRLTLGCMSLLLTLLLLLYLATIIPPTATSLPIIVKFYGQTLVVVVVSVCVSASLLRLTDSRHPASTAPPPTLLKTILTGPLGTILFLQRYTDKVGLSGGGGEDGEVLEEALPASYLHEWILVAAAVDRLAALTFVATFVITLIAYVSRV
ncbi:Neuronal acetylcholine receptor subunit alpha-7-like 6 [Homarus americanus]|uniref:Neuronal acetylcholine receptor subunit alpha-7-like 6 n=1 Tax=Homarus americanus TaxID=6706 RepID=A0A8J5JJL8_HOMAM|nr:Neuronal acetylcholine receptor subunit alpha-7-like 6 [Homarus americanus]